MCSNVSSAIFEGMTDRQATPTSSEGRTLLVIGSNPPVTSGQRTLGRADLARRLLGFDQVEIANLFSGPTYRTGGVALAGVSGDGWLHARTRIQDALDRAEAMLLAYGTSKPSGLAGTHHTQQVDWLEAQIAQRGLPVWCVGGLPRHPSRWQRYTFREHPGVPFHDALLASFTVLGSELGRACLS